jgi:hypothetical protein
MSAREEILDALRRFADHDFSKWPDGGAHPLIGDIVAHAEDAVEGYSAVWQLVAEGIIVPGSALGLRDQRGNDVFKSFPYFSITSLGRELLRAKDPRPG